METVRKPRLPGSADGSMVDPGSEREGVHDVFDLIRASSPRLLQGRGMDSRCSLPREADGEPSASLPRRLQILRLMPSRVLLAMAPGIHY
jgi:hypothetical protein